MKASATDFFSSITNACSILNKETSMLKEKIHQKKQEQFVDIEANDITSNLLDIVGYVLDDVRFLVVNEEKECIISGGCLQDKCKHKIVIIKFDDNTFVNVDISERNKDYLEKKMKNGTKYNIQTCNACKCCSIITIVGILIMYAYLQNNTNS
tara:strand:+ start:1962 stop:2420 length:459 start_codon:yes stop_codon:yes gene_type:complete